MLQIWYVIVFLRIQSTNINDKYYCVMKTKGEMREIAKEAAYRVDFLVTGREINCYANAIYWAMLWGWGENIDEREIIVLDEKQPE